MAMARAGEDSGPSAFGVKLGISTGRHSPDSEPHTVTVNAETKVHWFFLEGAYVLHHIHGRDGSKLQQDFDLYLTRPGRGDIVLNPSREIADYGIKRNDDLQFRHKALPISVYINLHGGDKRKIEVNSGFPVMDIVPTICEQLGIEHHAELSLALELDKDQTPGKVTQMNWLETNSSLNGQGIADNDTLLLRKKFFILNEDVREALGGNVVLTELLYHQIHHQFVSESFVGGGKEEDKTIAKITALLHHIEQPDENISDEQAVSKVTPKGHQENQSFYAQTVMVYYQERVSTLQTEGAKEQLLRVFTAPQSILISYYPVKFSEDSQECVLTIDSSTITACEKETSGQLKPQEGKTWRLRELRGTECTHEDHIVKLNILGSWLEFYTPYARQIAGYVMDAHVLIKRRAAMIRASHLVAPEEAAPPVTLGEKEQPIAKETEVMENGKPKTEAAVKYEWPDEEAGSKPESETRVPEGAEVIEESSMVETGGEISQEEEAEPMSEERGEGEGEAEPVPEGREEDVKEEQGEEASGEDEKKEDEAEEEEEEEEEEVRSKVSSEESTPSVGKRPVQIVMTPKPEPMPAPAPPNSPGNEEKPPIGTLDRSSAQRFVHIPEYLGMRYDSVLGDYKLFHIVVLQQDIRTVLLHVHKPVREVVEAICSTFAIDNPKEYFLWIPTGIQLIIERYGGRPRSRVGKFVKRTSSAGDFAPRLDENKTLEDQYDFKIRPYLLHLKKYRPEDDVDAPDESTLKCGEEWPDCEHPDVARYRKFYQSWIGAVQGAYPIDRRSAIKLAGLLTHIYFGDRSKVKVWPPSDYDSKVFLPARYRGYFGMSSDVDKAHKELAGKSIQDCINAAIECCSKLQTYQGVFFDVAVPVKSDIMAFIPWNKMQQRMFGINQRGIFSVDKETGKILFTHRFSDIYEWSCSDNNFHLNFKEWDEEYNAYTFQTQEIVDVLELFVALAVSGKIRQAPARPPSLAMDSPMTPKTPASAEPVFDSPRRFAARDNAAGPKKGTRSRDNSQSQRSSSASSPTTYDAIDL